MKELSKSSIINNFELPHIPKYASINGHIFYICLKDRKKQMQLKNYAKKNGVYLQDHYECLHKSPFIVKSKRSIESLPNSEKFAENLLRLPIYPDLSYKNQIKIVKIIKDFFN
jgi:dTDP-4-amino-4,6-dideoxygalactose transaminase